MAKASTTSALDFLSADQPPSEFSVCAVFGDEAFLKREVLGALRRHVIGEGDAEFSLSSFTGKDAEWRDVRDVLSAASLFGGGRPLVIVEEADPFVSQHRSELEDYVAKPTAGVLVLEVKSWPGNTRLAKAVAKSGLVIDCKPPSEAKSKQWLRQWAKREHDARLEPAAVDALCELVPPELGILQQEVAKLALLAGQERSITVALVEEHVGGWRTRTAWEMIDAVAAGDARNALVQLDRLIAAGEQPIGLLAQLASTLRRFATATQLIEEAERRENRISLRSALERAGVKPFKLSQAEQQLRQIGRPRAKQLHQWLLEADLAMKGHNSQAARARLELERLVMRLSRSSASVAQPAAAAAR